MKKRSIPQNDQHVVATILRDICWGTPDPTPSLGAHLGLPSREPPQAPPAPPAFSLYSTQPLHPHAKVVTPIPIIITYQRQPAVTGAD